jgi:hypothetical protein
LTYRFIVPSPPPRRHSPTEADLIVRQFWGRNIRTRGSRVPPFPRASSGSGCALQVTQGGPLPAITESLLGNLREHPPPGFPGAPATSECRLGASPFLALPRPSSPSASSLRRERSPGTTRPSCRWSTDSGCLPYLKRLCYSGRAIKAKKTGCDNQLLLPGMYGRAIRNTSLAFLLLRATVVSVTSMRSFLPSSLPPFRHITDNRSASIVICFYVGHVTLFRHNPPLFSERQDLSQSRKLCFSNCFSWLVGPARDIPPPTIFQAVKLLISIRTSVSFVQRDRQYYSTGLLRNSPAKFSCEILLRNSPAKFSCEILV